jgi:PAS domain S-box-containing protein
MPETHVHPCTPQDVDRLAEACESRIVRANSISEALIETARTIRAATKWDYSEAFLVNGGRGEVQPLGADHDGTPEDLAFEESGKVAPSTLPDDAVIRSLRNGHFLRYDDLRTSSPGSRAAFAVEVGFRSALSLPILGLHGPLGMLVFGTRHSFTEDAWIDAVSGMQERLDSAFQRRSNQIEFAQLWRLSPDLMAIFDARGLLLDANPAVVNALGWTLDELFAIGIAGLVHPAEQQMAADAMEQLMRGDVGITDLIMRVRRSDGAYRAVSVRSVSVLAESSIILVARDVTDFNLLQRENSRLSRAYDFLRRSAEVGRTARTQEDLFASVCRVAVESGGYKMAWIGMLDPDTRIIRPVSQAGDTTGYLDGLQVPIDDVDLGSGPLGRALRSGKPSIARNIEHDLSMAPWRQRVLAAGYRSVAAFPIRLGETIIGNFSVFSEEIDWFAEDEELVLSDVVRDISFSLDSLQREEQRMRAEAVVREMEAGRLRAQRLESIGTLAGGVAHDLNNTLAPILLAVEMINARGPHPELQDYLKAIELSAHRGSAMVKQVLGFARGFEGEHVSVSPARVVRDVAALLLGTMLKDVRVDLSLAADLPSILAEPTQLHQVLLNLCVNAAQSMGGKGTLRIRAEIAHVDSVAARGIMGGRPGDFVCFVVSDTGIGIEPEHLDRIFEPFFTTKSQGEGTGLGLSTSLGIIQDHGGFISVQSKPNVGSTFRVFLPFTARPAASPAHAGAVRRSSRGRGELVLLVDDEPLIRELFKESFERHGYRVELAEDGAAGVAAFARLGEEVDIVVTDVKMPVMGGLAMLGALQHLRPGIRAIAISGFGEALNDVESLEPLGVRRILHKPFESPELFAAVREVLDER